MGHKSKERTRKDGEFPMAECILGLIVGGTDGLLKSNGVDDAGCGGDVQHLHYRVVHTVECGEEIGVSGEEDKEEQFVGTEGDALGVAGDAKAEEEDYDGEDMGHVSAETEDVHAHFGGGVLLVWIGVEVFVVAFKSAGGRGGV